MMEPEVVRVLNLQIRAVDPKHTPEVGMLLDEAFEGEAESRLVTSLRSDDLSWIPQLSLGAFVDGRLVGYALLTRVFIGEEKTPALSFAPLAVAPDLQRSGVGGLLTKAALAAAQHMGEGLVVVLGHPEYYPRFGFVPAADRGVDSPWNVPEDAWMLLELDPGAADAASGVVRYPSAFYDAL